MEEKINKKMRRALATAQSTDRTLKFTKTQIRQGVGTLMRRFGGEVDRETGLVRFDFDPQPMVAVALMTGRLSTTATYPKLDMNAVPTPEVVALLKKFPLPKPEPEFVTRPVGYVGSNTMSVSMRDFLSMCMITERTLRMPRKIGFIGNAAKYLLRGSCAAKYDEQRKVFTFGFDPRPMLGMAIATGQYTPAFGPKWCKSDRMCTHDMAASLVEFADVQGKTVLEPSAGFGAIVEACGHVGAASVDAIEFNPLYIPELEEKGIDAKAMDFLALNTKKRWDRIVMFPPMDYTGGHHVLKSISLLAPGGRMVALMPDARFAFWRQQQHAFKSEAVDFVEEMPVPEEANFSLSARQDIGGVVILVSMKEAE